MLHSQADVTIEVSVKFDHEAGLSPQELTERAVAAAASKLGTTEEKLTADDVELSGRVFGVRNDEDAA